MDSFEIQAALHGLNWNELTDTIKIAQEIISVMENQAIGVMENAQVMMKESGSHRFPESEREAFYRFLGFTGSYKQTIEILSSLAKHKKIKYAVAACADFTSCLPAEFSHILSGLYGCKGEPHSPEWQKAKEHFWDGFDNRKKT